MTGRKLRITPDMFISGPYSLCSKCNTKNLGILTISSRFCSQRCRNCFNDDGFKLPDIKKTIIYLDQFVVSNFMKALDQKHPSFGRETLVIWRTIFEKIDTLLHYQLIICPYSSIHETESVLANKTHIQAYEALRSMYQHLGHGKKFPHTEEIKRDQFFNAFADSLGRKDDITEGGEKNYMRGFHDWSENIYIAIQTSFLESIIDDIKTEKSQVYEHISKVYDTVWKKEKQKYDYWFNLEMRAHGENIYLGYKGAIENLAKVHNGTIQIGEVWGSISGTERLINHH